MEYFDEWGCRFLLSVDMFLVPFFEYTISIAGVGCEFSLIIGALV